MMESGIGIVHIGRENLELIPGALFSGRSCSACLKWEDSNFWTSVEPEALLETKKRSWFQGVSEEFGACGLVALQDGNIVAYSEYALPRHFAALENVELPVEESLPFVACLTVARQAQGRGIGRTVLGVVETEMQDRGYGGLQALGRNNCEKGSCGPVEFWQRMGYECVADQETFTLVQKRWQ